MFNETEDNPFTPSCDEITDAAPLDMIVDEDEDEDNDINVQSWSKIFRPILVADLQEKLTFQAIWKVLIFSLEMTRLLKIEKWLEDWPLGCHPARNGHVTH